MLVAGASAPAADLTAPLPPVLAWRGASERLVARPGDPWITPSEAATFDTTPDWDGAALDPDARLGWFHARTPYYDDRYLLYPIGFER